MSFKKVQCKITLDTGVDSWVHFCYVEEELKKEFDESINLYNQPMNSWLLKWAAEDYGIECLDSFETLDLLKTLIREQSRQEYPEIYIESNTDSQGWLRVWVTKHMKEELTLING